MRAEAARKEKQRKQMITAVVAVVVVVIAVVVGVVIANRPQEAPPAASGAATTALSKLTKLPAATLDAAAAPAPGRAPNKLEGGAPLTADGKPKVLYVGAEFCPYCAMERWALIGALGRFGTFEGLKATTSATNESIPDIPTWSFVGSTYKSDYLAFEAVETQTREFKPLQTLEGENKALFEKHNPGGGIPWVTFGGTHATDGASVDAEVFRDATYDSLIAGILDPKSRVGQTVDPAINVLTAQLCTLTKNQPADVCTSAGVTAASAVLAK
jgi:thiol-disulfide isomerase/thioredoxin